MKKVGIFYGSTTGVTEEVAGKLAGKISGAEVSGISGNLDKLKDYDIIILGTSTWGFGDLQDDWMSEIDNLGGIDLSGKKVAYFGTGDQAAFGDTFVDGIGLIHDQIKGTGAEVIGKTSMDGYDFGASKGIEDGNFLGLVIDEVNQPDLTDERVEKWVEEIAKAF